MQQDATSEYEQERRQKLQRLRELGVDPFGRRTEGITPLSQVRVAHKPEFGQDQGPIFKVAGRLMLMRDMGKLTFMTLRDETGDLQIAVDKRRVDDRAWEVRGLLDLGDQVVAEGPLGATKKGEITIWATKLDIGAKSLLPPPTKEYTTETGERKGGFSDVELRYRQRYVDLWANPEVMQLLKLRIRIVDEVRQYLKGRGFTEVETPMLQPIHGGAAARPFVTKHNALNIPLYLRIAPELYLKRLLVGGFSKVFEVNRNFRNEGISPRHNPEFTMLEAYEAYGSWETMADLVEDMICTIAQNVFGTQKIEHQDADGNVKKTINLQRPWRRVRMADLVAEWTGKYAGTELRFDKTDIRKTAPEVVALIYPLALREFLNSFGGKQFEGPIWDRDESGRRLVEIYRLIAKGAERPSDIGEQDWDLYSAHWEAFGNLSPAEQLQTLYEKLIEPTLIDPTFVTHVPSVIIPLAKPDRADPFFADVYELAINGQEISPGYTELNDPDVQARQFAHQVGDREEQQQTDEDFLNALRYGMPPAGGMGLGIDRLVMMLTGAESIRDIILFPLMKPVE